ncbi:MAG: LptF/LptG family permease [Thermoguttaceae bacterium]
MRIIDRYMLRQFVQTFAICYFSLTGIYIVFDAFTNLESFLRCAKGLQLLKLMGGYYGFQSLFFFDQTSSLLALMAAMFTVAWIQRHNEITALMAAGISRVRVIMPVILAAAAISLFSAANRELVIPRFRDELSRQATDPVGKVAQKMDPQLDYQTDILIQGRNAYAEKQRIEQPSFRLPETLSQYGETLVADNAFYQSAAGKRPAGYLLDGVQEPKNVAHLASLALNGRPVLIMPRDAPDWLQPNQCFVVSDVTFDQLNGGRGFRSFASTGELIRALRNRSLDYGADIRVTIHSRFVKPLLDITLLLLGLPLVVTRESRNVFLAIGLCMIVVTIFLLVVIGLKTLGSLSLPGVTPAFAVWAPLLLFVPAAVGVAESMWEK